uniref:Caprin-2 n=1 Tax=Magallana gigas TaxID=29159 RepID=K1P5N7_MAGGI|eukprot:XP_019920457.1 PREDICTED: complement C1q tumor necrosis factor-related protein 3 [Crassostrea gigas]
MADEMKLMKNEIAVIRNLLREQIKRLTRLEMENDALKITVTKMENDNLLTKERRLLLSDAGSPSTTPLPVEPVAFYAYMSKSEPTPSNHHALVFDVLKTNLGNGYNKFSGTFVAPFAGTYVFTWTINTNPHGAHFINLMVNNAIVGGTLADTQDTADFDSDSNTAVVVLSQGDSVILRTTYNSDRADIYADSHAFTSFAGWRL